jgi:hypothetical protein
VQQHYSRFQSERLRETYLVWEHYEPEVGDGFLALNQLQEIFVALALL